jgi:hypothetical protein
VARASLPVAAILALLLAAPAARAESLLDRAAPEPAVRAWAVGEPPPSLKALKGRCALVEILDPDDLVSQGLVSRTVEIAAKAEERRLVVFSIATGAGADDEKVREFAKSAKVRWPVGVDRSSETFLAYGMPSLPRYFLIAPDGRVAWEGSPGSLDDRTLGGFIERARLWRPEEVAKAARPAAEAFVKGKPASAVKKANEILEDGKAKRAKGQPADEAAEKDARLVLDAVKDVAEARFVVADRLAKDRWSIDALEMLEGVVAGFAGTEHEAKAKERLAAIAADDRAQYEITAMKRLREILGKMRPVNRHNVQKAVDAIDDFLVPYGGTVSGDRARAEQTRLKRLLESQK